MASNRSKLIQLTDYSSGAVFMLSSCQIISFTAIATTDTQITYISQRGKLTKRRVNETVAAIASDCVSNTVGMMIPVTLDTGIVLYLNIDRVIYVDALSNSGPLLTAVTYDAGIGYGVNSPEIYKCSLPTPANFNSVTDNTFNITTQPYGAIPSKIRYINSLKVAVVSTEAVGSLPTVAATYKIKLETVTPTAAGTGYTDAIAVFTGGGPGAVLPTGTVTFAAGLVTGLIINTAGSNITQDVLVTITTTTGDGLATFVDKIHHILDTLPLVSGGSNINTTPVMTFSAGTVLATATFALNSSTQSVTATPTITNVGSYVASAFPPTITISGGAGAFILYDEGKTEFKPLNVEETIVQLQTLINAL